MLKVKKKTTGQINIELWLSSLKLSRKGRGLFPTSVCAALIFFNQPNPCGTFIK